MYKLFKDPITQQEDKIVLKVLGNGAFLNIPFVDDNTDYQEYLAWLAEGNTPEAADQITKNDGLLH